jgi:predicted nucleotidyltransferase
MRPSAAIAHHRNALLEIAHRHGVSNVRTFGSVARGEDDEGSDIDLLVDPSDSTSYFDLARIKEEAETLTGVPFDIHTPDGLKDRIREGVIKSAKHL